MYNNDNGYLSECFYSRSILCTCLLIVMSDHDILEIYLTSPLFIVVRYNNQYGVVKEYTSVGSLKGSTEWTKNNN